MVAFTPPETWENGEITLAILNARIRDKLIELQAASTPGTWTDLTLEPSSGGSPTFTAVAGSPTPGARLKYDCIELRGWINVSVALTATAVKFATLPTSMVPTNRFISGAIGAGGAPPSLRFDARVTRELFISGSGSQIYLDGLEIPI